MNRGSRARAIRKPEQLKLDLRDTDQFGCFR